MSIEFRVRMCMVGAAATSAVVLGWVSLVGQHLIQGRSALERGKGRVMCRGPPCKALQDLET